MATAIPNYGWLLERKAAIQRAYNQAISNIRTKRQGLATQYGYTYDVDPSSGAFSNYRIDPNNQYGLAQMLLKKQGGELDQIERASVERGLRPQFGGLGQGFQSEQRFLQGAETTDFGRQWNEALTSLTQADIDARRSMEDSMYSADMDALMYAIQERLYGEGGGGDSSTAVGGELGGTGTDFFAPLANAQVVPHGVRGPEPRRPTNVPGNWKWDPVRGAWFSPDGKSFVGPNHPNNKYGNTSKSSSGGGGGGGPFRSQ